LNRTALANPTDLLQKTFHFSSHA